MLAVVSSSSYQIDFLVRLMVSKYNSCHLRDDCVDLCLCLQTNDPFGNAVQRLVFMYFHQTLVYTKLNQLEYSSCQRAQLSATRLADYYVIEIRTRRSLRLVIHVLQNPPCWRARHALGENKVKKKRETVLQQGAQKCDLLYSLTFFHADINQSEVEDSFQLASDWIKSVRKNVNKSKAVTLLGFLLLMMWAV